MKSIPEILLVEDNAADQKMMTMAFESNHWDTHTHIVADGAEALVFLNKQGQYVDAPRPDLIILDLNIPVKHGLEVLEQIKTDPVLRSIPVVVFTSSESEREINRSYWLGANSYLVKRIDIDDYIAVVREIQQYWLSFSELPTA